MSCDASLSNFERKKKAMIDANLWKSNFVSLWKKHGNFTTVNGVECLSGYRIDGDGEGQRRMSKHLRQPDLWEEAQDDDLEWVQLYFNLNKLVYLSEEIIEDWIDHCIVTINNRDFDELTYEIISGDIVSYGFYLEGVRVDDDFLDDISFLIAEKAFIDARNDDPIMESDQINVSYSDTVSPDDIEVIIPSLAEHSFLTSGQIDFFNFGIPSYYFRLPSFGDIVRDWSVENTLGTNILDDLVAKGFFIPGTDDGLVVRYYLSLDAAKRMNGFVFLNLVIATLDFSFEREGSFFVRFLKAAIGFILAVIAFIFGYIKLGMSLLIGFFASKIHNPIIKIIAIIAQFLSGDISGGISSIGASEAVNLLLNLYSVYMELRLDQPSPETEPVENDQYMFYKAPYSAYKDIYCYKSLISVSISSVY